MSKAKGAIVVVLFFALRCPSVDAQTFGLIAGNLQKRASGVLTLMGYTLTPDVTTGSISISNEPSGNPDITVVSLGGGATIRKDVPIYLEGTAGFARYDPTFVATNGLEQRFLPVKWNSFSATGGIGWDFPIAKHLVLRPVLNFSLGHVESDAALAGRFVGSRIDKELEFLENGRLNAYGVGGSVMLDYERYQPENEIDVELRYTNILLRTFGSTSDAVEGSASAQVAGLWARWRAPTGISALDRPLRYVLELAHSQFLGDLRGVLGFGWLSSVGTGLELDSSKYGIFIARTRLVGRYQFGDGVQGWSVGLAVSF